MSQYIRFGFRLAQDFLNLSLSLGIKAVQYIEDTLTNWSKIQDKNFWNCSSCGLKFDLATTEQKETCTVCRIRRVIEN